MQVKILKKNECMFIAVSIMLIGIIIRLIMLVNHFTHCDDIGATSDLAYRISNINSNNPLIIILKHIESCTGFWTYAPFQLLFTSFLVNLDYSYKMNLILSRIPSFICGVIIYFILYKLIKTRFKDKFIYLIIALLLLTFSWENIIYCAQMEPYEIVVLFGFIVLLLLIKESYKNVRISVITTIILILGCYSHYQFYFIVFAYYLSIIIIEVKNINEIKKIFICGIINFLAVLPGIYVFIRTGMFKQSINWNSGIDNIFLFDIGNKDITNFVICIFKFFIGNFTKIYKYFFTVYNISLFALLFSIFLIVISVFGLINLFKNNKRLIIFYTIIFIVIFILVLCKKLSFGPSRHLLFLFPFLLYLIIEGIDFCITKFHYLKHIIIFFCIVNSLFFCFYFKNEYIMRYDYVQEEELNNLASAYNIDAAYFCYDYAAHELIKLKNFDNLTGFDYRQSFFNRKNNLKKNAYPVVMIVTRNVDLDTFMNDETNNSFKNWFIKYMHDNYCYNDINYYNILYKDEFESGYEIEYDSKDYNNYPNGKHIYIVKFGQESHGNNCT